MVVGTASIERSQDHRRQLIRERAIFLPPFHGPRSFGPPVLERRFGVCENFANRQELPVAHAKPTDLQFASRETLHGGHQLRHSPEPSEPAL